MTWSTKKLGEINVVKKFLANQDYKTDYLIIESGGEEPVDAQCNNKKYQIVHADFDFPKLLNTTPKDNNGVRVIDRHPRNPDDVWQDYIVRPTQKKSNYGKSANGVILLIDSYTQPPFLDEQLDIAKKDDANMNYLKQLGFDEIHLVCPDINIKIF